MKQEALQPLIEGAMTGDKQAYSDLCEAIIRDVLYICIKITGNLQQGEDAAQDVLIHLGTSIKKLRDAKAFPLWLNRCIANTCRNHLKKERRQRAQYTPEQMEDAMEQNIEFLPEEWAEQDEMRQLVLSALRRLPARQQYMLLMFYFEDMSIRDIAAACKINENAAKSSLSYARKCLKRSIEKSTRLPSVAPLSVVPTLTLMFRKDAALLVTEESVRKVLVAAGAALAGGTASVAIGAQIAAVVSGIAPTAVAVIVTAAITIGSSPSPSAPPAHESGITPQYSESVAAPEQGEGDLYIESAISGDSPFPWADSESEEIEEAGVPQAGPYVVAGSLTLVDGEGNELRHQGLDYTGVCVRARAPGVPDTHAFAEADGSYELHLPSSSIAYTITVEELPQPAFGAQETEVQLAPGESRVPPLELRDTLAPECIVDILDEDGGANAVVNPAKASLQVGDATPCTVSWQILPRSGGAAEAEGTTNEADIVALGLAKGRYTLVYTVCDLAGNTTRVEVNFVIR